MRRSKLVFLRILTGAVACALSPAFAQSFQTYHCADGSQFIVGFYPHDSRAFLQIDGTAVTLPRRLAMSGFRYSGGGVTLKIARTGGVTIKHARLRESACQLF
jgi:membrane-bound inhibitor of C-type lysozyme